MESFRKGLAEILEVDEALITPDLLLAKYAWDSLAIVSTIALSDECYGLMPKGTMLANCKTVADVEALIERLRQSA